MGMYLITLTRDVLSDLGIFKEMTLAEGGEADDGALGFSEYWYLNMARESV